MSELARKQWRQGMLRAFTTGLEAPDFGACRRQRSYRPPGDSTAWRHTLARIRRRRHPRSFPPPQSRWDLGGHSLFLHVKSPGWCSVACGGAGPVSRRCMKSCSSVTAREATESLFLCRVAVACILPPGSRSKGDCGSGRVDPWSDLVLLLEDWIFDDGGPHGAVFIVASFESTVLLLGEGATLLAARLLKDGGSVWPGGAAL